MYRWNSKKGLKRRILDKKNELTDDLHLIKPADDKLQAYNLEILIHLLDLVVLTPVMRVLNVFLITSAFIFTIVLAGIVSAETPNIYCYDEDMEGYICFETRKVCENEQENDILADSKCYVTRE